jgi:stearoyl-CoA desaturase (delta-9 desaturase)
MTATTGPKKRSISWVNAIFITITPIATIALMAYYIPRHGIVWQDGALFFFMYIATGLGITAGYHRCFSHQAYTTHPAVRLLYLLFGGAAIQNSALKWSRDHRLHHQKVDTPEDPYNIEQGFFWAHMGWIYFKTPEERDMSCVPDLARDKMVMWQHKYYLPIVVMVGFALPTFIGYLYGRPFAGFLFGGWFRTVLVQHMTFCINSLAHYFGTRPYSIDNTARDSWWLAFITYGEGYHNYHHRFAADYRNGIRWYHFDPTKWWILGLKKLGLVGRLTAYREEHILKARLETDIRRIQLGLAKAPEELSVRIERRMAHAQAQLEDAYRQWDLAKNRYREMKVAMKKDVASRKEMAGASWVRKRDEWRRSVLAWKMRSKEYNLQFQAAHARWALMIVAFSRLHGGRLPMS